MVKVPEYLPQVSTRPIYQQGLDANASPEAFGAGIGRGMQQAAQGLGSLGSSISAVQELEDIARAKEADNNYANWMRERMYGENGFMTMEGRNAVDARSAFETEAAQKRKEFGSGLTPGAAKAYGTASQARLQSIYQQSIVHTANERKTWFKEASAARVETFANDALVNYGNPAMVSKNIAAGLLEIQENGRLQGWDADTLKLREAEFTSGVHKNVALRIAQTDAIAADAYVKKHAGQMTGAHQFELTRALETELIAEQSKREADAILSGGRKVSDLSVDIVAEVAGAAPGQRGGPTRSKAFLSSVSAHKDRPGDTLNLDNAFADNLAALIQDAPPEIRQGLGLGSAYRSNERQKELFEGSDKTGRRVAFPAGYRKPDGSIAKGSNHLHGRAVDLTYNGQRLDKAPAHVVQWVHENARKYGMYFPMSWEPWHIEPTRGAAPGGSMVAARNNTIAPRTTMPSYDDIEARLAAISDPDVRDATRKRLYSAIEAQSRATEAREKQAKAELWQYIDQGATPDQVPMEVRQEAGMAAVSSAWEYVEKSAKRELVTSDETLLYDMRRYAAMDPSAFADLDLNDYRDRLSREAIKELTGLQTTALTDQRKAREEGLQLTNAFSQAGTQLEAVGISTTGKDGSARQEAARRIAQFQNALAAQMDEFKRANDNRAPTQPEIQSMINRLLLPVVIRQEKSMWNLTKTPWSMFSDTKSFLFEAGSRPDGTTVDVAVEYDDIPIDLRRGIALDLERDLGRKPSQDEIVQRYEDFVLNR